MSNMSETLEDGAKAATEHFDEAKSTFEAADQVIRDTVRDKPLIAVGAAVGLGYLIGRIIARR